MQAKVRNATPQAYISEATLISPSVISSDVLHAHCIFESPKYVLRNIQSNDEHLVEQQHVALLPKTA